MTNGSESKQRVRARPCAAARATSHAAQLTTAERKALLPTIEHECLQWMQACLHYKFKATEFWAVLRENGGEHLVNLLNVFTK